MKNTFHSATLRLTAWYTLILMFVALLFSSIVYQVSAHELQRGLGPNPASIEQSLFVDSPWADNWREERLSQGRSRLLSELIIFNIGVLLFGAGGSYLLARRTLQPIEDTMEAQARFTSDAAHELRTPLTIMQSEIEVGLRDTKATKSTHADLLRSNLDEVAHMRTLTDRLLLLANQNDLTLSPTSLETVAIEAVDRSVPLAQTKNIAVHNEIGPVTVQGNGESLTDVLFILIDNAIKYSPAKSTVTLRAKTKGNSVEVSVSDTGPGIAEQDLPYIFDRFYRADQSRSSQNVAGHGLGLSIAQRIIEAHSGTISAANNKKKGATLTITLPLA